MTERLRRIARWAGYPAFGLFSFLVFLYLSFPYDRLKSKIEAHLSSSGEIDVTIGDLGPRPLLGVSAEQVAISFRPKPGEAPVDKKKKNRGTRLTLEQVVVKAGLFGLLGGGVDIAFALRGLGGEAEGSYEAHKKKGWAAKVELTRIDLARLPFVAEAVGLPVAGKVSARLDLTVPLDRWSEASGMLDLECDECSVGDGKAKLKVPGNPLLAMGITLPQLRLGKLGGHIKIEKGVATVENLTAQSPDIEVAVEGSFMLRNPFAFSTAQAYLRFRLTPELKRRDPKFELVENGLTNAKRGDGFFGLLVSGPLRGMRFLPSAIGPSREGGPRPGLGPGPRPGFRALGPQGRAPVRRAGAGRS